MYMYASICMHLYVHPCTCMLIVSTWRIALLASGWWTK